VIVAAAGSLYLPCACCVIQRSAATLVIVQSHEESPSQPTNASSCHVMPIAYPVCGQDGAATASCRQ
jgi:hypothetical protein